MKNELNDMDIKIRIGEQIVQLRKLHDLTQQQLADAAGITRTHLSRIESGKYAVKLDMLDKIAHALGVKVELVS